MARPNSYPDELVAHGVRLALESDRPIAHVAPDLGMNPETLRKRVRQAQAESGARPELLRSSEREEIQRKRFCKSGLGGHAGQQALPACETKPLRPA